MSVIKSFSSAACCLRKGYYRHYKGHYYQLIDVGRDSETLEEVVIYRAIEGEKDYWVRPLQIFLETVALSDGSLVPRFDYVGVDLMHPEGNLPSG